MTKHSNESLQIELGVAFSAQTESMHCSAKYAFIIKGNIGHIVAIHVFTNTTAKRLSSIRSDLQNVFIFLTS